MKVNDFLYGTIVINEPVLIDLVESKPIQRLKLIAQYGIPKQYYPVKGFSRFDHSIGVMHLLKKLGAPLEEQIAGLLHDASHTAFSHIIDWVIGDSLHENYQDLNHKQILAQSDIPKILKMNKISFDKVADIESFGLLEQSEPILCADRVDYALREFILWANPNRKEIDQLINDLTTVNSRIVFKTKKSAYIFGKNFLKLQTNHWGGKDTASRYYIFSNILKNALENKIISIKDFSKTDDYIIDRLLQSDNKEILNQLEFLKKTKRIRPPKKGKIVLKKFRHTDPDCIIGEKIAPLSIINKNYKKILEKHRAINKKGIIVNEVYA